MAAVQPQKDSQRDLKGDQQGSSHSAPTAWTGQDPLPATFLVLTFATGLVDAVSYVGLGHIFTANMTGNVVFLGFALAGTPDLSIPRSLAALAAFVAGAALAGRLGLVLAASSRRHWLLRIAVLEGALLLAAAASAWGVDPIAPPPERLYAIIVLTGLAMGVRNATVRQVSVPDLTTTVLTLTIAGLAADSFLAGGSNPRWLRRLGAVVAMLVGAALGVLLLRYGLALPLFVAALAVVGSTLAYSAHPASLQPVHALHGDA